MKMLMMMVMKVGDDDDFLVMKVIQSWKLSSDESYLEMNVPSDESYLEMNVREDIQTKKLFNSGIARKWEGEVYPCPNFLDAFFTK